MGEVGKGLSVAAPRTLAKMLSGKPVSTTELASQYIYCVTTRNEVRNQILLEIRYLPEGTWLDDDGIMHVFHQ